jgi:hypothetical protein
MHIENNALSDAWRLAAAELHVRLTAPFTLPAAAGDAYEFVAHVPDFGSEGSGPRGLLVYDYLRYGSSVEAQLRLMEAAAGAGYVAIGANPAAYVPYQRNRYEETLTRQDWLGPPGHEPAWHRQRRARLTSARPDLPLRSPER